MITTGILPSTNLGNYSARMKSMSVKELKLTNTDDLPSSIPSSPFGEFLI
jgi:hypothetical protein